MIFVTLGTHHQPFARLMGALSELPSDELVVQCGHSVPPAGVREATAFLGFQEMLDRIRAADVVVTHAGVGSILLARREGHTPIVVPRLSRLGEHVDDHQVELTEALAEQGKVIPVWDVSELPAAVASAPARSESRPLTPGPLHDAVRAALTEQSAGGSGPLPVSVVIPAYNRPEMTRRAVESALGQRPRPPAEVIVVDDCSTDGTGAAAAEAGARVIRHERNQGEAGARNTGVGAATQPWIGLLDSDDVWLPHLLDTLWPLRAGHVMVAGSAMYRGPDPDRARYAGPIFERARTLRSPMALVYPGNFIPASGVIVHADTLREAGGYTAGMKFGADLDLWLRVLARGTGVMSPRVVVDYHVHEGQVTQDREGMARAYLEVLHRYARHSWSSRLLTEGWRGGSAWDRLRRQLPEGDRSGAARSAAFIAAHPARVVGLAGILYRRHRMRRRTAQLERAG
ncbi:MAG: hypothetical protein QOH76_2215 [Thermoleophilaceae bacterium]|nr:hypothetical protein [Thermoleophilaceae bacterium]